MAEAAADPGVRPGMVVVQAGDGLERLARYLARPPVSLQRMEWDLETGEKVYRTGRGHAEERGENLDDDVERIDELEFLARVVTQLPEPRKHSIRYYGYYAAVVRGKRRRAVAEAEASMAASGNDALGNPACDARGKSGGVCPAPAAPAALASEPDTAERRQLRKNSRRAHSPRLRSRSAPLRVRRDDADRRNHHRAQRDHEDPHAPREGSGSYRNGGSGPRPFPPAAPRAGARSLRHLNPWQKAGPITGWGEASRINFIARDIFLQFLDRSPRAATDAIHQLSANYYDAQKDLRALGLPQSAGEKLARLLLEWVEYAGEALRVRDLAALRRIARE